MVVAAPGKQGMVMRTLQMRLQQQVEFQVLPEEQEQEGQAELVAELHPWVVVEQAGIRMESVLLGVVEQDFYPVVPVVQFIRMVVAEVLVVVVAVMQVQAAVAAIRAVAEVAGRCRALAAAVAPTMAERANRIQVLLNRGTDW